MNETLRNIIIDSDGDPETFKGLLVSELGVNKEIKNMTGIFLIDCKGECACDEGMIDNDELEELKELELEVKTFPEFYKNDNTIYQRTENHSGYKILGINRANVDNYEEVLNNIVDLLNNGTITIKG